MSDPVKEFLRYREEDNHECGFVATMPQTNVRRASAESTEVGRKGTQGHV